MTNAAGGAVPVPAPPLIVLGSGDAEACGPEGCEFPRPASPRED
ncbi:hypothetical protein [Mycetocola spongiae]|nr:hypothetical protein [Mycetocola spongiae]